MEERRRVEELIALYEVEPTLRDVYVEGSFDFHLITWFLRENSLNNPYVYEINDIEIPAEIIEKHNLPREGNRSRVIALALELKNALPDLGPQATCIVDKDLDSVLFRDYKCDCLLLTDYSSIELYAFDHRTLRKFLHLFIAGFPYDETVLISRLRPVLEYLFSVYAANRHLGWNLQQVDFEKSCSRQDENIIFDESNYVQRCLNKNGRMKEIDVFNDSIRLMRERYVNDERNYMHGHAFVALLTWYLNQVRKNLRATEEIIQKALITSIELVDMQAYPLFSNLLKRVTS